MGITIHYQGRIRDLDKIPKLTEEMRDFAKAADWEYRIIDIRQKPCLRGISLDVHPRCESFSLTFVEDGELKLYFDYQDIQEKKELRK